MGFFFFIDWCRWRTLGKNAAIAVPLGNFPAITLRVGNGLKEIAICIKVGLFSALVDKAHDIKIAISRLNPFRSIKLAASIVKSVTGDGGRLAPCFHPRHSPVTGARYKRVAKRNTY